MKSIKTAATLMLMAPVGATHAAAQSASLSGIWQIETPVTELKAIAGKAAPLRGEAAAAYGIRQAQLKRGDRTFDPSTTGCKPPGTPRILLEAAPFEILQTPTQVFFTYSWNNLYRIVDIDSGQPVLAPTYFGTSHASWKGGALVVDAQGLRDETLLDGAGMPHSDSLHVVETYRRVGTKLVVHLRIEDPQTFSRPWDTELTYVRLPTDRLSEDICEERSGRQP